MAKYKIKELASAVTDTKNPKELSVGIIDAVGEVHTLLLSEKAQEQLFLSLVASDPNNPRLRKFRPGGVGRFRTEGQNIGISFLVSPGIGIHLELSRPQSTSLVQLIETNDDPASWLPPHGPRKQ